MPEVSEAVVKDALRQVKYPEVAKDVVACGIVKRVEVGGEIRVAVELPTMVVPAPAREAFEQRLRTTIEGVAGGRPNSGLPPRPSTLNRSSWRHITPFGRPVVPPV